jgi:tRNA 2-(methylsulfanyl)-N6-isopentenyladenosine37 hydroxylase
MLHLQLTTDKTWAALAQSNLDQILVDHAWCEQKAASTGISLIVNYAHLPELVDAMTALVEEEWGHFRRVIAELKAQGIPLGKPRNDIYAKQLLALERRGSAHQLLDRLLTCAIIEARSYERFKTLSEQLQNPNLREFYRELMESEAGHYTVFTNLARAYYGPDTTRQRLDELMAEEARIITALNAVTLAAANALVH